MSRLKWAPFTILLFFYPFFFPTVATSHPTPSPLTCHCSHACGRPYAAAARTVCVGLRPPTLTPLQPCQPCVAAPACPWPRPADPNICSHPRACRPVCSRRSRTRAAATASSTRAAARHPVVAYSDVTCAKKRDEPCPLVFEGYRDILDFGKYS
jgi:hypothetical protein